MRNIKGTDEIRWMRSIFEFSKNAMTQNFCYTNSNRFGNTEFGLVVPKERLFGTLFLDESTFTVIEAVNPQDRTYWSAWNTF